MGKKNILFVDDSDLVIDGIKRQLRPLRNQWETFFAYSGQEALELMSRQPIDLIVSDMMMPQMRGDQLLKEVRDRYPGTVRMILSGYADEETLKSGLEVAHQFLSKPCTPETLREAIAQVFQIQKSLSNPQIANSLGDAQNLPSLPKIYDELNRAIENENITAHDLAEIFSRDMTLSVKLLHLVNSPYFGLYRVISNLTEAINLIGIKKLNNLVLSVHIRNAFPVDDPEIISYMEYLWQDACRVAELARLIAQSEKQEGDRPDQAYLGGLLHNMGLLIFMSQGGAKFNRLMAMIRHSQTPVPELEKEIYGFNRFEAAAYILSLWKIPPRVIESILLQSNPSETDYNGVNALTAVHVASCLLKPSVMENHDRLFDISMDLNYLKRIDKLECLETWQKLADKILAENP